ncbi:hypothetical protein ACVWVZ_004423 [Pseudomonas tolaasii]
MRYLCWLIGLGACLGSGMAGLAIGINCNPKSTVKFVLVLDSDAWAAIGACCGAIFTAAAVALSLHYSRRDFHEGVRLISESHLAAGPMSSTKMTLRAVCTGRLPATIINMGFRVRTNNTYYPIAMFTPDYDSFGKLERGDIVEARLQSLNLQQIARGLSGVVGTKVENIELYVQTGLSYHTWPLSSGAIEVMKPYFAATLGLGPIVTH